MLKAYVLYTDTNNLIKVHNTKLKIIGGIKYDF